MPISNRKFYKKTFKVTVLSENDYTFGDINALAYSITEGDNVGEIEEISSKELGAKQIVKELNNLGSQPEFFMLNDNGEDQE